MAVKEEDAVDVVVGVDEDVERKVTRRSGSLLPSLVDL